MRILINYLFTLLKIYIKKIRDYTSSTKHKNYKKFIILSHPRVGSTFLLSLLNDHPHIIVKNEIVREINLFPANKRPSILSYLKKKVFKEYNNSIKSVGFKFFYEHAVMELSLTEYLEADKTIQIIHLKRKA